MTASDASSEDAFQRCWLWPWLPHGEHSLEGPRHQCLEEKPCFVFQIFVSRLAKSVHERCLRAPQYSLAGLEGTESWRFKVEVCGTGLIELQSVDTNANHFTTCTPMVHHDISHHYDPRNTSATCTKPSNDRSQFKILWCAPVHDSFNFLSTTHSKRQLSLKWSLSRYFM